MFSLPNRIIEVLDSLASFCVAHDVPAWIVGGAARDIALGRAPHDLDIAVDDNGVVLARRFADQIGAAFVVLDAERGVGRVVLPPDPDNDDTRLVIDLVRLQGATLEQDLRKRDFTINALALPLAGPCGPANLAELPTTFIDPCQGLQDIATRELRACSSTSLRDDPLRILRAARLGAELDLSITPALDSAIRQDHARVTQPAAERIRDELLKLLSLPHAAPWLHYLDDVGVLTRIIPELEPARSCEQPIVHFLPVLAHLLEAVTCAEWLLEGIAAHDGEPPTSGVSGSPDATYTRLPRPALPAAVRAYPDLSRELPYADRLREHMQAPGPGTYARTAIFKLATLCHDVAKPQTKRPKPEGGVSFYGHQQIGAEVASSIARRLRLSRSESAYVELIVRNHMRPGQLRSAGDVTPRAIVRFFRDTGDAGPEVLLHALADHMATRGPLIDPADWNEHRAWMGTLLDMKWSVPPEREQPLVNGHELMQVLGIGPGPLIGTLLREIHDAQVAGDIHTPAEALTLARELVVEQHETDQ